MAEFTRSFPDDPELNRLVQAFETGDYNAVRIGAPALAESTSDPRVRKAAVELRRRIEPAAAQLYLLGLTLALLIFLVAWVYLHQH
jgi:hypothetical protein